MKNKFRNGFILLCVTFLTLQCEKEPTDIIELDNSLKTVSITEALDYFNNSNTQQRNGSEPYVTVYTDYITNADINNSDEMLTVLPAVTTDGNSYSRVLLLNVDGVIESVVYSMFSSNESSTENFYGDILVTDLEGNFISGYKMEDGYYVSRYIPSVTDNNQQSRTDPDECFGITCGDELGEVIITARRDVELGNLYTSIVPEDDDFTYEIDAGPSTGGGGGGGDLNSNTCPNGYVKNADDQCVLVEDDCGEGYEKNEEGECEEVWTEEEQNRNILCGTYNFMTIGSASVANIANLGFRAVHPTEGQLNASFSTPLCVTIPNYNLPLSQSSIKFNAAWALTMNQVLVYLNNTEGIFNPTPNALRVLMIEFLTINLNAIAGIPAGVSVISSACSGVPISIAYYCPPPGED